MKVFFTVCLLITLPYCYIIGQSDLSFANLRILVHLDGEVPSLPEIEVDKDIPFCGVSMRDPVLLVRDGFVQNTVVSIDWRGESPAFDKPEPITLSGSHCLMKPRIQTARSGVVLQLNSKDTITHNPHGWLDDERTVFNITIMDPTHFFRRRLKSPGRYRVDCDTHTWMRAFIWVFDHPFHAVTDEDGSALIPNLPPGTYTVRSWHEVLGERSGHVTVEANHSITWEVTYQLADHRPDHLKPKTKKPWLEK